MFLYGSISWTTGDAPGGRGGFGGHYARAGLNTGDGRRQITIPNSGSRSIVNIRSRSNVGGQVSMSTALICPQFHPDVSRVYGVTSTNAIYVCGWLVSKEDLNKVKLHSTAIPPNPTPKTQSKTYSKTHSKAYNTTS